MIKNIILTSMSTLPGNAGKPAYYYYKNEKVNHYCWGISQLEAGTKHFLSTVDHVDDILVVGSNETIKKDVDEMDDQTLLNNYAEVRTYNAVEEIGRAIQGYSAYAFYRYRIARFINGQDAEYEVYKQKASVEKLGVNQNQDLDPEKYIPDCEPMSVLGTNKDVAITFVPLQLNKIDNIKGVVDKIKSFSNNEEDKINLYVDVQGGQRTDSSVRNAVMSILSHGAVRNINVIEVVGTNFDGKKERLDAHPAHEIVDETKRYQINDLVAGMNAFLQYGKADLIKAYCDEQQIQDKNIEKLVSIMQSIDEALSLCDVVSLKESIVDLQAFYNYKNSDTDDSANDSNSVPLFDIMESEIQGQYGRLLTGDYVETIELVKWAVKNKFYQQAVTIIEALMPEEIVREGIIYYASNAKELDSFTEQRVMLLNELNSTSNKKWLKPPFPKYEIDDINHLYIKHLYDVCFFEKSTKSVNNKGNGMAQKSVDSDSDMEEDLDEYSKAAKQNSDYALEAVKKGSKYIKLGCKKDSLNKLLYNYFYISSMRNAGNHASSTQKRLTVSETDKALQLFIDAFSNAKAEVIENDSVPFEYTITENGREIHTASYKLLCDYRREVLEKIHDKIERGEDFDDEKAELSTMGNSTMAQLCDEMVDLKNSEEAIRESSSNDMITSFLDGHPLYKAFISKKLLDGEMHDIRFYFKKSKGVTNKEAWDKVFVAFVNSGNWYKIQRLKDKDLKDKDIVKKNKTKSKKKKEAVIENNPENETITVPYLSVIKDTNLKSVLYQEGKSFKCIKCIGDLGNWMSLINGNPDDYDVEYVNTLIRSIETKAEQSKNCVICLEDGLISACPFICEKIRTIADDKNIDILWISKNENGKWIIKNADQNND